MKTRHVRLAPFALLMIAVMLLLGASPSPKSDAEIPDISKQINDFTIVLLKHTAESGNAPANVILSPQCIFHGLAMSYIASGGETRKELASVFHFPDNDQQLLKDLKQLRRQLNTAAKQKRIEVNLANSAWLDETYAEFRKEYIKAVREAFDASLQQIEFKQKEKASEEINRWISGKTHGKIRNVVSPDDFKSKSAPGVIEEPALVLVNAVYFNADWGTQFDKTATRMLPFHVDASITTETTMMHQHSLLPYSENDEVKFLEIPYIGSGYSMYVILPKEIISVRKLMDAVTTEMIANLKSSASTHEVDVLLPKFEMKSNLGMKDTLSQMGVRSAFNRRADFDKMIIKNKQAFLIYISQIYHSAWIDVHEEGTEAAAATATVHYSGGCSAVSPKLVQVQFHADHPFLFMVVHNQSRSILFAGWMSNSEEISNPGK